MTRPWWIVSIALSAALVGGAVAEGGGHPLAPAALARAARDAAQESRIAVANITRAARDSAALVSITRHVEQQLAASRDLLRTQRRIEASSRVGVRRARSIAALVRRFGAAIGHLEGRLRGTSAASGRVGAVTGHAAGSASTLAAELVALRSRYDEVVRLSRELDRKARGYRKARQ